MTDREPEIRVRLYTAGAPLLQPRGEYDIKPLPEGVSYTPRNGNSSMVLHNLRIGMGFHWDRVISSVFTGKFEVTRLDDGTWQTVNILPLEDYLRSVTGSEMNPDAPQEFLKAHAVISRGWALARILGSVDHSDEGKQTAADCVITWEDSGDHTGFHVCSDDHCQRYQGLGPDGESVNSAAVRAVEETRGLVLTDKDGNIADTRFSKCCGGTTELFSTCWQDRDPDYLPAQPDPWCDLTGMTDESRMAFLQRAFKDYDISAGSVNEWTATVDKAGLASRLKDTYGIDLGHDLTMSAVERGPSGRISKLRIDGAGSFTLGKELAIRRLLSPSCLRSSAFDIEDAGDRFLLRGKGWGHGVGLCQTGAARMAGENKRYDEILSIYYPNTKLKRLYGSAD